MNQNNLFETDSLRASAKLSGCGRYRYELGREWDSGLPVATWIMLNPSTADASIDDPTIRRCIGFSKSWGFGGLTVLNLFAFRSPSPKKLFALPSYEDAVGGQNNETIRGFMQSSGTIIAAWGAFSNQWMDARKRMIRDEARSLWCLGRTKDGSPRHPLYVPSSQQLEPFDV